MRWQIRCSLRAIRGIRAVPRGPAAAVTAAIDALAVNQFPPGHEVVQGTVNTYSIVAYAHVITYQVVADQRIIKILVVE